MPSLAGPKRPQDRVALTEARDEFRVVLADYLPEDLPAGGDEDERKEGVPPEGADPPSEEDEGSSLSFPSSDPPSSVDPVNGDGPRDRHPEPHEAARLAQAVAERERTSAPVKLADGTETELDHGHVVIAAITSCTNTSNPAVMLAAGLLARNAVARGLKCKPWVKTSLAPGSMVVTEYLDRAGLTEPLDKLGFNLVGYGCTTCIGNSGPLPEEISEVVNEHDLAVVSVLSGNRNFEGRINPDVKMNYLASPPLVVAYALAGTMDIDIVDDPLGQDEEGNDVHLRDIWPSEHEIAETIESAVQSDMFRKSYEHVFDGDERWNSLEVPTGDRFAWDDDSTYVRRPPYFDDMPEPPSRGRGYRRRARAGPARRQRDHRPHLPGGRDQARQPRRPLPAGARRQAQGLQLLRLAPRKPRGHGARHVRQHPPAQPDGAPAPRAASRAISPGGRRRRCRSTTPP